MKFQIKIILLLLMSCAFVLQADAQLCGQYKTVLAIKTEDEKPVTNAVVQLVPLGKDETRGKTFVRDENDLSVFSIFFYEGHQLSSKYKLLVSADGFKTFETELKFPHCKQREFNLKLENKNSKTNTALEEIKEIKFWINYRNKKGTFGVKVTVISEDDKTLEEISDEYGAVSFKVLDDKKYKVRFEKEGYKSEEIEIDLSKKSSVNMNIELEQDAP